MVSTHAMRPLTTHGANLSDCLARLGQNAPRRPVGQLDRFGQSAPQGSRIGAVPEVAGLARAGRPGWEDPSADGGPHIEPRGTNDRAIASGSSGEATNPRPRLYRRWRGNCGDCFRYCEGQRGTWPFKKCRER